MFRKEQMYRHDFVGKQTIFLIWETNTLFLCNTIPFWVFDRQSDFTVQGFPRPFMQ